MFCVFHKLKEEKDDLKRPSVLSGVSEQISSLLSCIDPHLFGGSSYFWTASLGHCPESWDLDHTLHWHTLVLYCLTPRFSLASSTRCLTSHLTSTGIFCDLNFSKKTVMHSWPKEAETNFRHLSDHR